MMKQIIKMIRRWLKRLSNRIAGKLLCLVPLALMDRLAALHWCIGAFFSSNLYWQGRSRRDIGLKVLKLSNKAVERAQYSHSLEVLLDRRMVAVNRRRRNWPGLLETARQLQDEILRLRKKYPGRPVVISPFHYVSQYVNIHVCDALRQLLDLETLGVVSGVPYGIYGDDGVLVPNLRVFHTYADGARHSLGINFFRALKKDGVAVLFADVAPFAFAQAPMETVGVSLFGKPGRIHSGVFRLGAKTNAILLPFYLRFRRGRFQGIVMKALSLGDAGAPQRVADQIETAMRDNYAQWLQSGHPAMYWFAANK